ncbi:MAG: beta-hydroxyacyl-ACP dehydratase [Planctomycetes bacterium]|nr:beta-hydroxyacyl-ACP dehydratase [Planctomycetota bacterium]
MPPQFLFDISGIDLNNVIYDIEHIKTVNPHRYEMQQLDGIVHLDLDAGTAIGYKNITENEFWIRGHIPERPLMPGVLMIEAAAQLASFCAKKASGEERFIAFGGIEDVRFRGQVTPSSRLYILGKFLEVRPRRFKLAAQGLVENQMIFHATVIGMPI